MPIPLGEPFSFDQRLPAHSKTGTVESGEQTRIVILGAGLAGLSCAYRLRQSAGRKLTKHDLLVLEREPRVGGRIRSLKIDARSVINLGALTFQPAHYPRYAALLRELGLAGEAHPIQRHRMLFGNNGRTVRADNLALAWDGVKSLVGRGVFTTREALPLLRFYSYHRHLTSPQGSDELMALHEISMSEWAQRFGFDEDLKRKIVEPFTRLCFCDPADVSAAFGIFLLGSNLSHPASLEGGFGQFAEALAARLEGLVETAAMALEAFREPDGFAIVYSQWGHLRRVHSKFLVVALPAPVAARIFPDMRGRANAAQYGVGRGTVVAGKLKADAELHLHRASSANGALIYGGEARRADGLHYFNVLTYRGERALNAAKKLFKDGRFEELADYAIHPAVAAPRPGQKPLPTDWGEGLYLAGDCAGLFPSQETAVNSGEQVAHLLSHSFN
jgi:hypothetical protein